MPRRPPSVTNARRYAPTQEKLPPIGDAELTLRICAYRDGCGRLRDAIRGLVERTAERLDIPADHADRPIAFARAYLGMEISE